MRRTASQCCLEKQALTSNCSHTKQWHSALSLYHMSCCNRWRFQSIGSLFSCLPSQPPSGAVGAQTPGPTALLGPSTCPTCPHTSARPQWSKKNITCSGVGVVQCISTHCSHRAAPPKKKHQCSRLMHCAQGDSSDDPRNSGLSWPHQACRQEPCRPAPLYTSTSGNSPPTGMTRS